MPKNTRVNINNANIEYSLGTMLEKPIVYDTVPVLGKAKKGPMVRYKSIVKKYDQPLDTKPAKSNKFFLADSPIATTPRKVSPVPVVIKPIQAVHTLYPASCPICTGNIRLPAPKNKPNNIEPIKDIPTFIAHGRYDVDCRAIGAWELSKKLNNCELKFLVCGHSSGEPEIIDALVRATDKFKGIIEK